MTSPVDTSVKLFWSGMANMPQLNGQAGSLIGVLDACLITGCDIKPVSSLVVKDGVATARFAGQHSALVDSVIALEGITGDLAVLNGQQKVTARPTADTLTFAIDAGAVAEGTASGAITLRMAPAGWSKPFASGSKAVYTSAHPHSLGMFLRVDDSTRNVRVTGYERMSDGDTGTGQFPTPEMVAGGGYWNKSSKADATVIPWVLAADARMLLLWMAPCTVSVSYPYGCVCAFGDPISHKPGGDAYAAILSCDIGTDSLQGGVGGSSQRVLSPRDYTGLGPPVWQYCYPYVGSTANNAVSGKDGTLGAFPNPITGELHLSRRYITQSSSASPRADLPGLYTVPQSGLGSAFNTGNVVPGAGPVAGRNLFAIRVYDSWNNASNLGNTATGIAFIDQTGPWR